MTDAARKPDRLLLVLLGVVGLLVVVALAVVFSRGEPEPLDEASPATSVDASTAPEVNSRSSSPLRPLAAITTRANNRAYWMSRRSVTWASPAVETVMLAGALMV